ncbi:MAG: tRNA (guanosine(37)-N1)-methyltransferase TrmD [Mariprofundaceae bacterium]
MFYAQILTLFPEFFDTPLACSIPSRAIEAGITDVAFVQIRDFTTDKHRRVDDNPYGGGPGMVMKPEPVVAAIRHARKMQADTRVVLLTPSGHGFDQTRAREYAGLPGITLVCGRYEGIDERVTDHVDEQLSVGEFVLSGGEPAAMCVLDAVIRLLPGALGDADSAQQDSHGEDGLLDWPHYTRPENFEGRRVPDVLLSGNHAAIEAWRREQARVRSERHKK